MLPIIDVSENNGILNWSKIKPQIAGAIIRCGYGGNKISQDDKFYFRNVEECTRLNIPFGVYLFSYAKNQEEAIDEANHALRLVQGYNLSFPIYIDLEYSAYVGNLSASIYTQIADGFCQKIESVGGFAGVYSNVYYWQTKLFQVNKYSRWIAQWADRVTYEQKYDLWQYTSDGVIAGSSARTDLSRYYNNFLTMVGDKNHFAKKPTPSLRYKLNDTVSFTALFETSLSTKPITDILFNQGIITKIIADARNPYLINNGSGWVNDSVITGLVTAIKVGDQVRVKEGAKDYNGQSLASFVYQNVYDVMEVLNDRIVIGKDNVVTAAMHAKDLYIV